MNYIQQQPHPELRESIRCYWKVQNSNKEAQNFTIFPDGFFDLLICYHNDILAEVLLSGLWDQKTNVVIPPATTIYGVQFRLLAIENILQENIGSSLNSIRTLENTYLGLDTFNKTDASLFEYLNQRLLSNMKDDTSIDPRKSILLKSINQTKGNQSVEYYAQQAHWSKRQINRYFQSTFGLSLKGYCSIRKGAASFSQIKKGQLFPKQGYFDQPHFIKGIKKITGYTPKVLLKNENDRFLQFSIIKNE